ncbi:MAG: replicative DNA helicase [Minisyncoccales bacterium]|jgi:replicative DNA helicase
MGQDKKLIHKVPPQSLEAEISLLGSLMIDKDAIIKVADFLQPRDFYKPSHQDIYQVMLDLFKQREPIDTLSVSAALKERNLFDSIGGTACLADMVASVPTSSHILNYAKIVQKKRILRDLIESSRDIELMAYKEVGEIDNLLDKAEKRIFSIAEHSMQQRFYSIKDNLEETFDRIDKLSKFEGSIRGVPTGFAELDDRLSGLQKSDLIILAARPSLGKSSLAFNIALNVSMNHKTPVGIFSLEMSKDQIIDRFISTLAGIDLWKLRTGRLSSKGDNNDFERIQHALAALSETQIYVDDSASSDALKMRAMARRLQADKGLGLIIVDYLQLIDSGRNSNYDSMVQQMSAISRSLKGLAKELNIPVLAISQLSRAVEQRTPQIPRLSDLRESGCLSGESLIRLSNGEKPVEIKKLVGQVDIPVYSMDENYRIVESKMSKVFSTGKKMIYQVVTESGKEIKASANHPFWRVDGWTRLNELNKGDYIATPIKEKSSLVWPREAWDHIINPLLNHHNMELNCKKDTPIKTLQMTKMAQIVNSPIISNMANPQIRWDKIVSIKELRVEEVYDASVPIFHNFIANDIIVENSIEQDADVVLFIHREDKYRTDTERKNVADIMIAKHRNGPVGKVELYFDEQTATFKSLDKIYSDETSFL